MMRIRQLVLVSEDRDSVVNELCSLFQIEVAFYDPGIIHFGLENAVLPVGDTFLEVVSPVKENTTAGRYLKKRKGDGGYMVIIQTNNFKQQKERVKSKDIEIVFHADRKEEGIHAQSIHLHPRDVGGAILSLDSMKPINSWLWAGKNWENMKNDEVVGFLNGVHIQSKDPEETAKNWERALGREATFEDTLFTIELDNSRVIFKEDLNGRGAGPESFELKVKDRQKVMEQANQLKLLVDGSIFIGGVEFLLN